MKKNKRKYAAWAALILLAVLIIATFVVALMDFPGSDILFRSLLAATILLPIVIWLYMWLFKKMKEAKENDPLDPKS